jgi:tripartite ATP-independent transporter DctP family solute receptor
MPARLPRRTLTLALATAALATPHVARAAIRVIRFGHNNTDGSHYGRATAAFAQAVAADPVLAAAIRIEAHPNAELGDEVAMLKSCAAGTLDAAMISNAGMGSVIPDVGVLNAPFLFRDVEHAHATLDGPVGQEFATVIEAKNLKFLAWSENGLRHVTANKPIRHPADLAGLKIRVPQSDVMVGGFKALGANPAPLSFSLVREALRTGDFQAQENPIVVIEAAKLYELQKYVSLTGHIYDPAAFLCSTDLAEDLGPAQLEALAACARKGSAVARQVSANAQVEGLARLRANGMTIVDDVDVDAFRTATRPYMEGLAATYGADRMRRLIGAGA